MRSSAVASPTWKPASKRAQRRSKKWKQDGRKPSGAAYRCGARFSVPQRHSCRCPVAPMIEIRALTTPGEFRDAVDLQKQTWGFADIELIPVRVFVTSSSIGGQVIGAYQGSRLIGFCLSIPGVKQGGNGYLHSHMLAVDPGHGTAGLGCRVQLAQAGRSRSGVDALYVR